MIAGTAIVDSDLLATFSLVGSAVLLLANVANLTVTSEGG
jgi:hypothetical protein